MEHLTLIPPARCRLSQARTKGERGTHRGERQMKQGRTIQQLAEEIARQSASKKDYLADTRKLTLRALNDGKEEHAHANVILDGVNGGMGLRPTAHAQLSSVLGIPKPYYDRMLAY